MWKYFVKSRNSVGKSDLTIPKSVAITSLPYAKLVRKWLAKFLDMRNKSPKNSVSWSSKGISLPCKVKPGKKYKKVREIKDLIRRKRTKWPQKTSFFLPQCGNSRNFTWNQFLTDLESQKVLFWQFWCIWMVKSRVKFAFYRTVWKLCTCVRKFTLTQFWQKFRENEVVKSWFDEIFIGESNFFFYTAQKEFVKSTKYLINFTWYICDFMRPDDFKNPFRSFYR